MKEREREKLMWQEGWRGEYTLHPYLPHVMICVREHSSVRTTWPATYVAPKVNHMSDLASHVIEYSITRDRLY